MIAGDWFLELKMQRECSGFVLEKERGSTIYMVGGVK